MAIRDDQAGEIIRKSAIDLDGDGQSLALIGGGSRVVYSDYQATLANGAEIDSGWIDMAGVDKVQLSGYASAMGMTATIDSRANDSQTPMSTPVTYTAGTFYMFNIICRQRYMRFKWTNNTGSPVTEASLEIKQTFGSSDKLSVFPVNVQPSDFSQAALVQAITRGQQPDGDYVATPADGEAFSTTTSLGGTRLNGAINDSVTTITVDDTTDFASSGTIGIDTELITYTGKTATTFTGCTRGALGTTAASHVDNEPVGGAYVSDWTDTDGWSTIEFFIKSGEPSKLLGLLVQFTDDVQAATPEIRGEKRYSYSEVDVENGFEDIRVSTILDGFRAIYVNGVDSQATFYFSATLRVDAVNSRYNKGGALVTADFDTEVALGFISNYEIDTKFGRVKSIDAADNAVDIWSFADDTLSVRSNTKTFPTSASTFYLASSSSSDTSVQVEVAYIDNNGFDKTTTVTLNGQTPVSLGFSALDVNRMEVMGSTAAVGIIYCTTANNYTSGSPNDVTQVVAVIPAGYGQTQQTHFTVPDRKKLIIKAYDISLSRGSGAAGSADVSLRIKPFGKPSVIKREFFPTTGGPVQRPKTNIVVDSRSQIVWRLDDVSDNDTNCVCVWDYELIDD